MGGCPRSDLFSESEVGDEANFVYSCGYPYLSVPKPELSSFHLWSQLGMCSLPQFLIFSFVLTQTSRLNSNLSLNGNLWRPGLKRLRKLQELFLPNKVVNVLKWENEKNLEFFS